MTSSVLSALLNCRLDEICFIAWAVYAAAAARRQVRQAAAMSELPRSTYMSVAGFTVAGLVLAELTVFAIGHRLTGAIILTAAVRLGALGIAASGIAILLRSSARIAVLRSDMRGQADGQAGLERELKQAKLAAEHANHAKNDFLGVMSHELRTPLNSVLGFATLLGESRLDESQRAYVSTIRNEGARLDSLLNDILDFSKIEEGRLTLEHVPFAPAEAAHEVLRLLNARAAAKKLDLRFEA